LALKAGLWFRRGRLLMGLSCLGHYARSRQNFHLNPLFKNPEPALINAIRVDEIDLAIGRHVAENLARVAALHTVQRNR
jgi:hypothetical protein